MGPRRLSSGFTDWQVRQALLKSVSPVSWLEAGVVAAAAAIAKPPAIAFKA